MSDSFILNSKSGYEGTKKEWDEFLKCWNSSLNLEGTIFSGESNVNIFTHPVTSSSVLTKEVELKIKLPKSLTDFLYVTNGMKLIGFDDEISEILSLSKIELFANSIYSQDYKMWIRGDFEANATDEEYFVYDSKQDPIESRDYYLKTSVVLSKAMHSGVVLLNPKVQSKDGEMEILFLSARLPGILRFRSFGHFMKYAYYKSVHSPEFDYIYEESLYENSCANHLTVNYVLAQ